MTKSNFSGPVFALIFLLLVITTALSAATDRVPDSTTDEQAHHGTLDPVKIQEARATRITVRGEKRH